MFFGEHYFYGPLGLETGAREYTAKCLVMFKASESTQMVNGIGPFTEVLLWALSGGSLAERRWI